MTATVLRLAARVLFLLLLLYGSSPIAVSAQMPDLRAMSGRPLPSPDLPDGTVTVRVIRGTMTNNVAGVEVELHGAGPVRKAVTGPEGRAQFSGLPPGASVRALVVVGGQRLESGPLGVPARGGVRTLLVAADSGDANAPAAQPQPPAGAAPAGDATRLSLGSNSRIAVEFSDDVLQVFYLLEIVNRSDESMNPPGGLVFALPDAAEGTAVLEGSSPLASAAGNRVTVCGPLPPGITPVQIGFRVDSFGEAFTLEQPFPLPIEMVVTAVQKIGDLRVASPQLLRSQDVPLQGTLYIMGSGPALPAGSPLVLSLTGLPHHRRAPMWIALGFAAVVIVFGAWLAWSPRTPAPESDRERLESRRADGLAALAALEQAHRGGTIDDGEYASRRAALVRTLEALYAQLDEPAA